MDETNSPASPPASPSGGVVSSLEVAQYIQEMAAEMGAMATASGLVRVAAGLQVIRAICEVELAMPDQS